MVTRNQPASNISTLSNRFRTKKLSLRQTLTVLRESDFDSTVNDDPSSLRQDALSNLPKVETGVESKEEKEHHLQAVISASNAAAVGAKVAQIYIPTPDAVPAAGIEYGRLYPPRFAQPATYIRFSSTVEDSIGCPYCMTDEDEAWLKSLNERRRNSRSAVTIAECSEDQFETVMQFYEDQSMQKQPFAAVDRTPVLTYEEMEAAFDETVEESARKFAKDIHEYWRIQRMSRDNQSLMAKLKTLKMDSGQEADDSDPYVCFRRREVRQVRKTRGRDAQIAEKLRKLRKEIEEAREILNYVKTRELVRVKDLSASRQLFEQRASLRKLKRALNITGTEDDELLVTQKTPKKKAVDPPSLPRGPGLQLRVPNRIEGLTADIQQFSFSEKWESEQRDVSQRISESMSKHDRWNEGFIDRTLDMALQNHPLTPDADESNENYVGVRLEFNQDHLMTPPASIIEDSPSEEEKLVDPSKQSGNLNIIWANSAELWALRDLASFRIRHGRSGRLWLDRKLRPSSPNKQPDRWAYDQDSSDDDARGGATFDELFSLKYRFHLKAKDDHARHVREQESQRRHMASADTSTSTNQTVIASRD